MTQTIRLNACLDIAYADTFKQQLLEQMATGIHWQIDASAVERMTTPCIQLVLAACNHASEQNGRVTISACSDAFTAAFADLGLTEQLKQRMA